MTFDRWRAAEGSDPAGSYPFGGEFTGYRSFDGLTIPSEGRCGWFYGTDRWSEASSSATRSPDCERWIEPTIGP